MTTNPEVLAALIKLIGDLGPALVKSITDLIHGNPQQSGETDDAYIARLNAAIDAKLADADKNYQTVINAPGA